MSIRILAHLLPFHFLFFFSFTLSKLCWRNWLHCNTEHCSFKWRQICEETSFFSLLAYPIINLTESCVAFCIWLTSLKFCTLIPGISSMNLLLTDSRASCGHSWNQSMAVQLTMAGNFRALTRSVEPTGEKHKMICRDEEKQKREGEKKRLKHNMVIKKNNAVNCGGSEPLPWDSQTRIQFT